MVNEHYEQYLNLGKNFLNPWNNVGKTVMDMYRNAGQEVLEIAGENLTRAADQLSRCSSVKRPDEWFNLSKEIADENLKAGVNNCQKVLNLYLGNFEEINKAMNINLKDQQGAAKAAERERAK